MLLAAVSIACGNVPSRPPSSAPAHRMHFATASCPLKTPKEWQTFLTTTVDDETWVKTCSGDGTCEKRTGAFKARVRHDVLDLFDHCAEDLANNPSIAQCTARLRRFAPAWMSQHEGGSYGFVPGNSAYLAAQTTSDKPAGMMDLPVEIVRALPDRARIEGVARTNGWPFVTQDSCFGGVRTFVTVVDGDGRFDQWFLVQYGPDATVVPENSVMSFIAVQKKAANGEPLKRVRLHFRDYIAWKSLTSWQLALPETHEGKCYACHGSGMRLLLPAPGNVVAELNERLASYGLPDWDGTLNPTDHGPALGERLACTTCHDGVSRGPITVSTDEGTLKRKIVDELSMQAFATGKEVPDTSAMGLLDRERTQVPPLIASENAALDRARREHAADYRTFMAERFPVWRAWMLEERCE
jgi:hypothetical protein